MKIKLFCEAGPDQDFDASVEVDGHSFRFRQSSDGYGAYCSCGLHEFTHDHAWDRPRMILDALHGSLLLCAVNEAFDQKVCYPAILGFFDELAIQSIAWADQAVLQMKKFLKKQAGAFSASDLRAILFVRSQF